MYNIVALDKNQSKYGLLHQFVKSMSIEEATEYYTRAFVALKILNLSL